MADKSFLILGGGGLVGLQIARRIAYTLDPDLIVIAALTEQEAHEAVSNLQSMFTDSDVRFESAWGNIFVRSALTHASRRELLAEDDNRQALYDDLFGRSASAYEQSRLVQLVHQYRPDVIIDAINTATAISYQDTYTASRNAKRHFDRLLTTLDDDAPSATASAEAELALETVLISQAIPQLVRHVTMLHQAMCAVGTRLYLKIGTTGTGGMGLNIPYTHGEDKPSATLMSKTAVAFAHTGLLFLMARTVDGPIVKEIKPGAMIGYADIASRTINEHGQPVNRYSSRTDYLQDILEIRSERNGFEAFGPLELPVVDTGENGLFTRGEFEAITSLRQMEFITPEEIARETVLEIRGGNTGADVIAAIDSSVLDPTYRAGYLRQQAIDELINLERETGTHSIAWGQLGPPQLSKLLWEAELLRLAYGTLKAVVSDSAESIAAHLYARIENDANLRRTITSVGVPILCPDGQQLIRGPFIRIPEVPETDICTVPIAEGDVDAWAKKGWVDLRPENLTVWQERFRRMEAFRKRMRMKGSAAITRSGYLYDNIRPGSIVGWIFNTEEGGYRIK
ncbi:MAG: hypothetical protein M9941_07620 [Anaerolineae bacterium]|nr:hypothetical protein [Anaerolineae bacterium]